MKSKTTERRWRQASGTAFAYVCASLLSAAAFAAAAGPPPPQQVVKFGDLNLNRAEDVAALYARVRSAANQVCSIEEPDLAFRMLADACVSQATERAISSINSPALTSYYQQRLHMRHARTADQASGF